MWLQDNVARHYKRATMVGFTLSLANTAGVAVGQIYTTQSSPRYIKGMSISLGLTVVAMCMVFLLAGGMTYVNRNRETKIKAAEQAGNPLPSQPELGDYDVHFKYTI
jgi:FtsH-binding integral membrane protein